MMALLLLSWILKIDKQIISHFAWEMFFILIKFRILGAEMSSFAVYFYHSR